MIRKISKLILAGAFLVVILAAVFILFIYFQK